MTSSRTLFCGALIAMLLLSPGNATHAFQRQDLPFFSCSTFPSNESESDLVTRFGAANVTTALIEGGGAEGEMNPGTVLLADRGDSRMEIFWKDKDLKRRPDWIHVYGGRSQWRSPAGITLGTDLRTLEKLNGRAFRLLGFGVDDEGGVVTWVGGKLVDDATPGCKFKIYLSPRSTDSATGRIEKEVLGDREYSSGHPAMQQLNPQVYQMFLLYGE